MRPFFALFLATLILGGVVAYTRFSDSIRPAKATFIEREVDDSFSIQVTCTFAATGDAFGNAALRIKFRDAELLRRTTRIEPGEVVILTGIDGVREGQNDFFVSVSPLEQFPADVANDPFSLDGGENPPGNDDFSLNPESQGGGLDAALAPRRIARAVHVQVFRGIHPVATRTLWSDQAGPISELVPINIPPLERH